MVPQGTGQFVIKMFYLRFTHFLVFHFMIKVAGTLKLILNSIQMVIFAFERYQRIIFLQSCIYTFKLFLSIDVRGKHWLKFDLSWFWEWFWMIYYFHFVWLIKTLTFVMKLIFIVFNWIWFLWIIVIIIIFGQFRQKRDKSLLIFSLFDFEDGLCQLVVVFCFQLACENTQHQFVV